jgi:hypothetical protein
MPIHHNPTDQHLKFELGDERFCVAPGNECEIPKRLEYAVASRGLPLKKGRSPVDGAVEVDSELVERTEPRLPEGVETGPRAEGHDEGDDEEGDDDDGGETSEGDGAGDESSPVADALARLAADGVQTPGKPKRGKK